ncbi:hypothetical protein LSCM4_08251 [Leishmania orientalis]|uniref:Uncharacterized protein n=1 Tax=Leishmania orientalis TaxID=2249476 RepID=A0A836HKQ9_9TRYP|nr:hypothetical protein LSCM4_08251 [Leishmania orientalis]
MSVPCAKRCSVTHSMGKTTAASLPKGVVCFASRSHRAAPAERHGPHPSIGGLCRGGSLEATRTHLYRPALRSARRSVVCVWYLLLPLLLYSPTPPSAPPSRTPAGAATAPFLTPFLFARATQYSLPLAFQASDDADDACIASLAAAPTSLRAQADSALGWPMKEAAVPNISACPHYPMWALLAGVRGAEVLTSVVAGSVNTDAADGAGVEGGVDSPRRAHAKRGRPAARATVAEAATHRRTPKAAAAAAARPAGSTAYAVPRGLISALSGPRKALSQYYQVLNTDTFFLMLQGCTIRISIDTDVQPSYPYDSFQRYANAYVLDMSATGGSGSIHGHSSLSGNSTSSATTRANATGGDEVGEAAYPNITLHTAFFFWNQARLHCTLNAPALMSMMIDLINQQQEPAQSQLRYLHTHMQAREESRRALLSDGVVSAEVGPPLTASDAATDSTTPSSTGSVYPSCAANMPSPNDILSSSRGVPITRNSMQLSSTVVVKIFSFDVWYQLVGAPVPSPLRTARASTTAAPPSATYASSFSSGPHMRSGGGSAGASNDSPATAGYPFDLLADPEKVCTAPALYTISLNPLLAQASSWTLGSAAGWLQSSATVTHEYPAARVIAVVAQCSGVPLSFSVTASFVNPGNFAGSGENYFTSIIYFFFLVCYALLLVVLLVMIVPCNKRRRRQQRRGSRTRGSENQSISGDPSPATAPDGEKQSPAESAQRCADKARSCGARGQRRGSYAAGADSRDSHLEDDVSGAAIPAQSTSKGKAKKQAVIGAMSTPSGLADSASAAVKGKRRGQPRRLSPSTASAAAAEPQTCALTQRCTTDGCEGDAGSEPLRREAGERGGDERGGGARQREDEYAVEGCRGGRESDDSQTGVSSLYSVFSRTSSTSSLSGDDDVGCGTVDAPKGAEVRAEGVGRRRGRARSSGHSGAPTFSSLTHTSSFTLSSSSSSGDEPDRSESSSSPSDSTRDDGDNSRAARRRRRRKKQQQQARQRRHVSSPSTSRRYADDDLDDDSRSSSTSATDTAWFMAGDDADEDELRREGQRRRRRCREQGAQAWWKREDEQRTRVLSAQIDAQGATGAFVSPRRWRSRAERIPDAVRRHVLHPLQVWWAESHILIMYAPIQWLVLVLIMLKCLLSILFAAKFFMVAGVDFSIDSMGYSLPLVCVIFQVATDSLLIPTEMLVSMGWGLAFTTPLPTNHIVIASLATLVMFIVFVFSATCENDSLSMAVTVNRYTKRINSRQCNAIVYTRAALELACRVHNVFRMLTLSMWLSKTVVPADAAAMLRHRKLRKRQLQRADHQGHGIAGAGDGSGEWGWGPSDLHRRTPSASSRQRSSLSFGLPFNAATGGTATLPSTPVSRPPPPRLGYPGVSLSAMEVYLRYRSMRVSFAVLLLWPILLLVCGFTLYEPEDYHMLVALREVQIVHLLGFIVAFLRTASPLYC